MFGNVFTLDYEIHGNGEGSPYELMVEPTDRLLDLFDRFGAKLTIMADIGEILKFKEYLEQTGEDRFAYNKIIKQLIRAITTGHDVQLHIHPSYFKSHYQGNRWSQNWSEYSLADLDYQRMETIIGTCKSFLEETLRPVKSDYECTVFRSGNWSMYPSYNIVNALINNDINVDTSVFKYGRRHGRVNFDYKDAYSDLIPWPVDQNNICKKDPDGKLLEVPIYCESKSIWAFLGLLRIFRILQANKHKHPKTESGDSYSDLPQSNFSKFSKVKALFTQKHALKMDFNQCSGRNLIKMLKRVDDKYGHLETNLPVVLIGHSKLFTKFNAISLQPFLEFVAKNSKKYSFATFSEFDLEELRTVNRT